MWDHICKSFVMLDSLYHFCYIRGRNLGTWLAVLWSSLCGDAVWLGSGEGLWVRMLGSCHFLSSRQHHEVYCLCRDALDATWSKFSVWISNSMIFQPRNECISYFSYSEMFLLQTILKLNIFCLFFILIQICS